MYILRVKFQVNTSRADASIPQEVDDFCKVGLSYLKFLDVVSRPSITVFLRKPQSGKPSLPALGTPILEAVSNFRLAVADDNNLRLLVSTKLVLSGATATNNNHHHRHHGSGTRYSVPLGGHEYGAAVHFQRNRQRSRQRPWGAWPGPVPRCRSRPPTLLHHRAESTPDAQQLTNLCRCS